MHKFQFVEKFSVKERRVVGRRAEVAPVAPAAPAAPVLPTAVKAAPGAPVAPAVPAVPEAVKVPAEIREAVKAVTGKDLAALQAEIQSVSDKANSLRGCLEQVGKIAGAEFQKVVSVSTPDFDALNNLNDNTSLYALIHKKLVDSGVNFSGLNGVFGITEENAGVLEKSAVRSLSVVLANSFIKKAKADFDVKYKHLKEFLKTEEGKPFAGEKIGVDFKFDSAGGFVVEMAGVDAFETAYKAFADKQPDAVDGAKAVEVAKKDEELPSVEAKIALMERTKVGKIMKALGVKFADVLKGDGFTAVLAQWIFSALGFGEKLGLGNSDVFADLPDIAGSKKMFDSLSQGLKNSAYHANKDVVDMTGLPQMGPVYEKFDEKFADTVKDAKALDSAKDGIVLEKEFKLGENETLKKVTVDLNGGGEIILDGGTAGAKLTVNEKAVSVAPNQVLRLGKESPDGEIKAKNGFAVLTGVIPAGIKFTNKCKLSVEKVEAKASKK
ncbi:MAG: hypothetical protein WC651_04250 [Candidatus Gracilibacteria bacterium]|jgi:hypothetical protein